MLLGDASPHASVEAKFPISKKSRVIEETIRFFIRNEVKRYDLTNKFCFINVISSQNHPHTA